MTDHCGQTASTSTGESVMAQGMEGSCMNVALHKVNLVSDFVTGPVVVDIRPTFPITGVSLLLVNDLAGRKVVADPKVTSMPITFLFIELIFNKFP